MTIKPGGDAGLFAGPPAVLDDLMRPALTHFSIFELMLVLSGAAFGATPETPGFVALNAILPAEQSNKACYVRAYDAAHLRAHPKQRIPAMKFLLGVSAYDPKPADAKGPSDQCYYTFSMSVARRGDKRLLDTSGDCMGSEEISCVVDCDGGGLALDKMPPAGSLVVRLRNDGIRMFHGCDEEQGVLVKPGADDKVFRLDKAANNACQALEEKEN